MLFHLFNHTITMCDTIHNRRKLNYSTTLMSDMYEMDHDIMSKHMCEKSGE